MKIFEKDIKTGFGNAKLYMELEGSPSVSLDEKVMNGFTSIGIRVHSAEEFIIKKFKLEIVAPILDVHGISIPGMVDNIYSFIIPWHFEEDISFNKGFPFFSLINRKGENKLSVGIKHSSLGYKLMEDFIEKTEELKLSFESVNEFKGTIYKDALFFSVVNKGWFDVVKMYSDFVRDKEIDYKDFMYEPVFCSWYAFYQNVEQKHLNEVAKKASELGFKVFILDDGWFTKDNGRGYWYTGDWKVCKEKLPDFKEHVRFVKSLGMKYVLWIAPFMVGYKSESYKDMENFIIRRRDHLGYGVLCPQSEEVKDKVVNTLERLLDEYDLDGFKIDFIDDVQTESCKKYHNHFVDNPSEALKAFFTALKDLGNRYGKDLIIELRQRYISPQMAEFGTAFRAADTPFDFDQNRRRMLTIRSFSGNVPVYSDPIVWKKGESFENISKHFIASIYAVPMLSVDLTKLSQDENRLIKFWLDFHKKLKDVLLFGELKVWFSNGEITKACAKSGKKGVCSLYSEGFIDIDDVEGLDEIFILNSSNDDIVTIVSNKLRGKRLLFSINGWKNHLEESRIFEGMMRVKLPSYDILSIRKEGV